MSSWLIVFHLFVLNNEDVSIPRSGSICEFRGHNGTLEPFSQASEDLRDPDRT